MAHHKINNARFGICRLFFCVVTVLSLAGVVSWLSLTPKKPFFRISDIHLPALDSNNHSSRANVSVPDNSILFNLEVSNPNKRMGVYYSVISLQLYNNGGSLGTNSTPAFYQGYKNSTVMQILIRATREFAQRVSGGNMDFIIRVQTTVRYRIIKWKTKMHQIKYEEQFRNVRIRLNGTVTGGDHHPELQNASQVKTRN